MVGYGDGGATMTTGTDGSGSRDRPRPGPGPRPAPRASEAVRLGDAIRSAYGDTYDSPWVYDAHEVARRIAEGLLVSAIAETDDGRSCATRRCPSAGPTTRSATSARR